MLMLQLNGLVDAGNTVIMVEHDMQVASSSDWVIDIGPGAGDEGGLVVTQGTPAHVARSKNSRTAPFMLCSTYARRYLGTARRQTPTQ